MSPNKRVGEYIRTGQKPDENELRKERERAREFRNWLFGTPPTTEEVLDQFDAIFGTK